jgi:hypothetical protein
MQCPIKQGFDFYYKWDGKPLEAEYWHNVTYDLKILFWMLLGEQTIREVGRQSGVFACSNPGKKYDDLDEEAHDGGMRSSHIPIHVEIRTERID